MAPDAGSDGTEELTGTIFALSSGSPPAAIAVIRISGSKARVALEALAGGLPEPRRASVASLRHANEVIDNALILWFPGPATATGEDLTELHVHGGRAVVARVLAALSSLPGLRAAFPGEFTRRAFENGRIDFAEAEGLADLLSAETESQRRAAMALAGGALSRQVASWEDELLGLAAKVEAELDFSDEGDVERGADDISVGIANLADSLRGWLRRPAAERLRDGVRIAIAGPPNSGKSSLINVIGGRDAAIVSPIEGTTRDLIEVPVSIGGTPYVFIDTAGLRDQAEDIEAIGVARAHGAVAASDLILWLGDPAERPSGEVILVQSKADLLPPPRTHDVMLSAITGEGIDQLQNMIAARAFHLLPAEGEVALHQRHRVSLAEAVDWLQEAMRADDLLIVAEALREARLSLDRITGRVGIEDVLDALFGQFCVGK